MANPIGSTSPQDLKNNARNLDYLLLGPNPSYLDRLGVPRKSWTGMEGEFNADQARRESEFDSAQSERANEYASDKLARDTEFDADQAERVVEFNTFLESSSFETPVDYFAGIGITRTTQVVRFDGELYRAHDAEIPFTTTTWAADEAKFFAAGDSVIRQELAQGTAIVAVDKLNPRNLSHYTGTDQQRLNALLNFAKVTGDPVRVDVDITLAAVVDVDFAGSRLNIDFSGTYVNSDITCLKLRNLAPGSRITAPNLRNITAPWTISRWDAAGVWIANNQAALSATLAQDSGAGRYMPTSNDTALWSSLTGAQQTQTISAKMEIYNSTRVRLVSPRGRFALYEFLECQHCRVETPDIEAGGKGTLGTIVFNNIGTSGYGYGNTVVGGRVQYGSFSGVAFVRQREGGVRGGFTPYRTGESGVKTFQNQLSGRSARCYNMVFREIRPKQTVFDGVDFCSDFGAPAERVDDYTLAQYAWNKLPTSHDIRDVYSEDCRTTGVWGDGVNNQYLDVGAESCALSGIKFIGADSLFVDAIAINNNTSNTARGEHQINIPAYNRVVDCYIKTDASITAGGSLYLPLGEAVGPIFDSARASNVHSYGSRTVTGLTFGSTDVAENVNTMSFHPRLGILANDIAQIVSTLTSGVSGSESGRLELKTRLTGALVHGLRLLPNDGGIAVMAMGASTASAASLLNNSEILFRQNGTAIELIAKLADGTVKSVTIAS